MANTRTITISEESYDRIVEELRNAKNALEMDANEQGHDLDAYGCSYENLDEWNEICNALQELSA